MINTPIRSPHGTVVAVYQQDVRFVITVERNDTLRYFRTDNWTNFAKDQATEISSDEFNKFVNDLEDRIMEVRRAR